MSRGPWTTALVSVTLFVGAQTVLEAQQRTTVSVDQLTKLGAARNTTLQRVGPGGVETIRNDRPIVLDSGDVIVATPPPQEQVVSRDSSAGMGIHWDVPVSLIVPTEAGPRTLRVTIQTGGGLTYIPDQGTFAGDVLVGLEDEERPHDRIVLTTPVLIQTIPMVGEVTPDTVSLAHTQVPLQRLHVTARSPGDSIALRILYASQDPLDIQVPVRRAALAIAPTRIRINGLGLEKARLAVMLPSDLDVDSLPISVSSLLQPDARTAYTVAGRPAMFTFQSRGLGFDTLRAVGPHFVHGSVATIEYVLPWLFLVAALLGGMVGMTIREVTKEGREVARSHVNVNALAGVLVGLLVAVAFAVGVNLLPIAVSGPPVEAVVFVVAGLGAFLGGTALRKAVLHT